MRQATDISTDLTGESRPASAKPPDREGALNPEKISVSTTREWQYLNNLLPAVGYLDMANALDFPANVWNSNPLPTFAIVLMALGGSIAILSTAFAFWDMHRCRKNVNQLHAERHYLKNKAREDPEGLLRIEEAWLALSLREIGWEYIDRILMDVSMAIAGILVGIGTLIAIRGAVPSIFLASNLLSGYIGNGFVALYALINTPWSVFMWMRARRHHVAMRKVQHSLDYRIQQRMMIHGRRHQIYAVVSGVTIFVAGGASLASATEWQGYVVLIPCIVGSIFCNYFWRIRMGYNRFHILERADLPSFNVADRLGVIVQVRMALASKEPRPVDFSSLIVASEATDSQKYTALKNFIHDYRLATHSPRLESLTEEAIKSILVQEIDFNGSAEAPTAKPMPSLGYVYKETDFAIEAAGDMPFRDEERFLLELYGCLLATPPKETSELTLEETKDDAKGGFPVQTESPPGFRSLSTDNKPAANPEKG